MTESPLMTVAAAQLTPEEHNRLLARLSNKDHYICVSQKSLLLRQGQSLVKTIVSQGRVLNHQRDSLLCLVP